MSELEKALREIENDDDFIQGVFSFAKTDEDRLEILRYINDGKNVTYENVLLLALSLNQKRKKDERIQNNKS